MDSPNPQIETLLDDLAQREPLLVSALREELAKPCSLWPDGVMDAVAQEVSASVWNPESRTYKGLDRRIRHAATVWADRYGPLNEKQRSYMSSLLIAAIRKAKEEGGDDKRKLYPAIHTKIAYLLNHEAVDAGFKKRATHLVDVSEQLAVVAP